MNGWIKLHRCIEDNFLWEKSKVKSQFEAWIDLLIYANTEDKKVLVNNAFILCKRGEQLRSLETLSRQWKWSKSKVKRFLDMLQKSEQIRHTSEKITTRITICNYDKYQTKRNEVETPNEQEIDTQTKPTKKYKEVKKEESKRLKSFTKPTLDEVQEFYSTNGGTKTDGEYYFNSKEANGWVYGKYAVPIKDWKADSRNWIKKKKEENQSNSLFQIQTPEPDGRIRPRTIGTTV